MKTQFTDVLDAIEAINKLRADAGSMFGDLRPMNKELGRMTEQANKLNAAVRRKALEAGRIETEIRDARIKAIEPKINALKKYKGDAIKAKIDQLLAEAGEIFSDDRYGEVLVLKTAASELNDQRETILAEIEEKQATADALAKEAQAKYDLAENICEEWDIELAKS